MEDAAIVALYWARDEQALAETAAKFGAYCRKIADNILHSAHDAEECENDTWLAAWNSMPTNRPARLAPYLGRITRNLALDRFDRAAAQKRGSGQTCAPLDELAECVAAPGSVEDRPRQQSSAAASARFCAPCRRKRAAYFCAGTGTATRRRTLPRGTA